MWHYLLCVIRHFIVGVWICLVSCQILSLFNNLLFPACHLYLHEKLALAQYISSRSLLKRAEVLHKYSNQNRFFLMDMKDGNFSMMDRISYIINLYVMINYVWWGYFSRDTSPMKAEGVLLDSSLGSGQSPGSFLCCSWLPQQ